MKERITTIDNTKAIGIILVITGHAISEYNLEMRELLNIIYSFHMQLFFIIHGIVKDYKKYKNTSFLIKIYYKFLMEVRKCLKKS